MKLTSLNEIADLEDGQPVMAVEGVVKYASKVGSGRSDSGNDWSRQFFVLTGDNAEIGCTLWDAEGNDMKKGEAVRIENTQNKKGQWSAMTKNSYQKDGKLNHTLEIRAGQAKIKPVNGDNLSGGSDAGEDSNIERNAKKSGMGTDQRTNPSPAQNSDGITEARQHLCQSANLYNLCVKCVETMVAPELPEIARTSEQFQATLASFWIEASSRRCTDGVNWWSYIEHMPIKPLPVPERNDKAERTPSNQEENEDSSVPF